jgi:RHS repeat-associated protein
MSPQPNCELHLLDGEVSVDLFDFFFPAVLPCFLSRKYSSARRTRGVFGYGWSHNLAVFVERSRDLCLVHGLDLDPIGFILNNEKWEPLDDSDLRFDPEEGRLLLWEPEGRHYIFEDYSDLGKVVPLAAIADLDGNRIELQYDVSGRLCRLTDIYGRIIEFSYDLTGVITAIEVSHPQFAKHREVVGKYFYDFAGDLIAVVDSYGRTTTYEYDSHYLTAVTNPAGGSHYYAYDRDGAAIMEWRSDGRQIRRIRRSAKSAVIDETDSLGYRWVYLLNREGKVEQRIDPLNRIKNVAFDETGAEVASDLNTRGGSTLNVWDEETQVETTTFGSTKRVIQYNQFDRPSRITDGAGNEYRFDYDANGRMVELHTPGGTECGFGYSEQGALSELREPSGNIIRIDRNIFSTTVEDSLGRLALCTYDLMGRPLEFVNSGGQTTRFTWAPNGDFKTLVLPDGSEINYYWDAGGYPSEIDSGRGSRVRLGSDWFGHPLWIETAHGGRYTITWDSECRPKSMRDANGAVATYSFDVVGRITSLVTFSGREIVAEYDDNDNQVAVCCGDLQSRSEFDDSGLLTKHESTNGPHWIFSHGPNQELMTAESEYGTWQFQWNPDGLLIGENNPLREITLTYDSQRLRRRFRDNRGLQIDYAWDIRSRLTEILINQQWTFQLAYDESNIVRRIIWPKGLRVEFEYDRQRRMTRRALFSASGDILADRQMHWASGRGPLLSIWDMDRGECHFTLDRGSRLLRAAWANGVSESYRYDPSSNLLNTPSGESIVMSAGNTWVSAGNERFEFGDGGHVSRRASSERSVRYEFDGDGALVGCTDSNGLAVRYQYDSLGRRISTADNNKTTRYYWDSFALQGEHSSGESPTWYVTPPGIPIPLAIINGEEVHGLLFDQIGTVTDAFSLEGDHTWRGDYDALLGLRREIGSIAQPLRALGQYHDRATRLYYNWRRYYDPSIGRFISAEPYAYEKTINEYAFSCNTTIAVDIQGLLGFTLDSAGVLSVKPYCDWPTEIRKDFDSKIDDYNAHIAKNGPMARVNATRGDCSQLSTWKKCIDKIKDKQKAGTKPNALEQEQLAGDKRLQEYRKRFARRKPQPTKGATGRLQKKRYSCRDVDVDHRVEDVFSDDPSCANLMPRNTHFNTAWGSTMGNVLAQMASIGPAAITSVQPGACDPTPSGC